MTGNIGKEGRYNRVFRQLEILLEKTDNPVSRMATVAALLHHKMNGYFWTGFYILKGGKLQVGPYQGPMACLELEKDKGVCWASINSEQSILVPDVRQFPGHITCDSRSRSEIVVPLKDDHGDIIGVLDIDSRNIAHFDEEDKQGLEMITRLI